MSRPIYRRVLIDRNGDWSKTWTLYPGSVPVGFPVDFTGSAARLLVYPNARATSGTPLLSLGALPTANGSVLLGGKLGTIKATATKASSLLFGPGAFWWNLWIDWATGASWRLLVGDWIVRP